jgi:hypothetical protein
MPASPLSPAVARALPRLRARYRAARPFPHAVLDGFLRPRFCAALLREFPPYDPTASRNAFGQDGKACREDLRTLGPAFRRFDDLAASAGFRRSLERLTGISGLRHDPYHFGGGAQENRTGMRLWPHVDFDRHPVTGWHRRLNLLLYLNPDWVPARGGELRLHSGPRVAPSRSMAPLFNRGVVFTTSRRSWHSVAPVLGPAGTSRRSVSVYYYTAEAPRGRAAPHTTLWVYPGLPPRARTGATLDDETLARINEALSVRDLELASARSDSPGRAWKSPLPARLRVGRVLSRADARWLRRALAERQTRLERARRARGGRKSRARELLLEAAAAAVARRAGRRGPNS